MSDMERKLHEAFDAVRLPEDLAARTLAHIEEARAQESDQKPVNGEQPAITPAVRAAAKRHARRPRRWLRVAVAACLAAALVGGGGVVYASESAYVEISADGTGAATAGAFDGTQPGGGNDGANGADGNAGQNGTDGSANASGGTGESAIELGLNCFNIVVRATGMNEAGEALLQSVDVVGKSYEEAANLLLGQDATGEGGFVNVTVTSNNASQREYLGQTSESCLGHRADGTYECDHASEEERHAGQEAGMGTARYQAYLELAATDPSFTEEDCEGLTLREMRWMIDALESGQATDAQDALAQAEAAGVGSEHHGEGSGEHDGRHAGWDSDDQGSDEGAGESTQSSYAGASGQGAGNGADRGAGQDSGQGHGQGAGHDRGAGHGQG